MLITQRREGESILIGGNIQVTVIEITNHAVRLGITAPKEVEILRYEVLLTRQQNLAAAQSLSPEAIAELLQKIAAAEPPGGK